MSLLQRCMKQGLGKNSLMQSEQGVQLSVCFYFSLQLVPISCNCRWNKQKSWDQSRCDALGAKSHSDFLSGKTVKSGGEKNLCFFHLTWSAISQPCYWQDKHWLAQQCLHPLSPGLVAIVTRLGDECDTLDSREKDFDSTDTSPEAQSWPQWCDCTSLFISLHGLSN